MNRQTDGADPTNDCCAAPAQPAADHVRMPCCGAALPRAVDAERAESLTADLEVLANPIRLRLLSMLAASPEPVCVCDLESSVPVKQPTVSHHLKLLRAAGLVESERRGLWAYYHVRRGELNQLRRRIEAGLVRLGGEHE